MYWFRWKSEKDWAKWARWAKILKIIQPNNQLYLLHVDICMFTLKLFFFILSKSEKKAELNELDEVEYSKTPWQMSSYAHWYAFLYFLAKIYIKIFIHLWKYLFIAFEKKNNELNELNELECSKTPSKMSRYAHEHVFFYLYAQKNVNSLLY